MPKYILKRIVGTIPTLIIVVTFVFFFVRLIPGDPARLVAGEQATQDDVEAVREELGLNKSIPTQYVTYVTGLLKGNLGTSLRTKQPVTKEVAGRFGNTVRLAFVTLLWSSVVGVLFGVWSGTHRGKWQDYTGMTIAVSGISLPSFWIGFLLIMLFAVKLRILPTTSGTSLKSLIMPSITLGVGIAAVGFMDVIKDLGLKEPYVGQVGLQTGEIAEDLTYYFATSEQVASSVGLGVLMNHDNTVRQAGGFIIQLMPFTDEKVIDALEKKLSSVKSVTSMLDAGMTPEDILQELLGEFGVEITEKTETRFACNCSKERMEKALISIGRKDLEEMIKDGEPIEMNCHFCNSHYQFSVEELKKILAQAKKR